MSEAPAHISVDRCRRLVCRAAVARTRGYLREVEDSLTELDESNESILDEDDIAKIEADRARAVRAARRWRRAFFMASAVAAVMAVAAWTGWILVWQLSR